MVKEKMAKAINDIKSWDYNTKTNKDKKKSQILIKNKLKQLTSYPIKLTKLHIFNWYNLNFNRFSFLKGFENRQRYELKNFDQKQRSQNFKIS